MTHDTPRPGQKLWPSALRRKYTVREAFFSWELPNGLFIKTPAPVSCANETGILFFYSMSLQIHWWCVLFNSYKIVSVLTSLLFQSFPFLNCNRLCSRCRWKLEKHVWYRVLQLWNRLPPDILCNEHLRIPSTWVLLTKVGGTLRKKRWLKDVFICSTLVRRRKWFCGPAPCHLSTRVRFFISLFYSQSHFLHHTSYFDSLSENANLETVLSFMQGILRLSTK
jgi:hypothetical protein